MNYNISVYVHIPYCIRKCHYCDFNSHAVSDLAAIETSYTEALLDEIKLWKNRLNPDLTYQLQSIFFGGGTPSLFSAQSIEKVIVALRGLGKMDDDCELSLEMNPQAGGLQKLRDYQQAGINRISMGIQSLQNNLLKRLGRVHSREEALQTLEDVFTAGFKNVSIDLMYGLSGQSVMDLDETLRKVLAYPLPHLSAYSLIVEEKTQFFHELQQGKLDLPDEEIILEQEVLLQEKLSSKGLMQYEISNYAREGFFCRHNLNYWNYGAYLGIGAGAVGFLPHIYTKKTAQNVFAQRFQNVKEPHEYCQSVQAKQNLSFEAISQDLASYEYMMMGLRKKTGISQKDFFLRFHRQWNEREKALFQKYQDRGHLNKTAEGFALSAKGYQLSNELLCELLPET